MFKLALRILDMDFAFWEHTNMKFTIAVLAVTQSANTILSRILHASRALAENDLSERPYSARRPFIYQVDLRERAHNDEEVQKRP